MSRRNTQQQNQTISLVATIFVAVAAIVLAVVAIITVNSRKQPEQPDTTSDSVVEQFQPTDEFIEECTYAAHDLVQESYKIIRLFVLEGLAHYDEPYGNLPEDGIYTVNSTEYTSLAQIEELVKSVYTSSESERILTNIDGNGLAVYQNREVLVEVESEAAEDTESTDETAESESESSSVQYTTEIVLGISADFKADTAYSKDWSSCVIAVLPKSENECELTVYLDGLNADTATEADADSVLNIAMVKVDGTWKLANFVY